MGPALVMQFYHDVKMVFIFIVTFMVGINIKDEYINFSQKQCITMMHYDDVKGGIQNFKSAKSSAIWVKILK